jgi:hypothetical protein
VLVLDKHSVTSAGAELTPLVIPLPPVTEVLVNINDQFRPWWRGVAAQAGGGEGGSGKEFSACHWCHK